MHGVANGGQDRNLWAARKRRSGASGRDCHRTIITHSSHGFISLRKTAIGICRRQADRRFWRTCNSMWASCEVPVRCCVTTCSTTGFCERSLLRTPFHCTCNWRPTSANKQRRLTAGVRYFACVAWLRRSWRSVNTRLQHVGPHFVFHVMALCDEHSQALRRPHSTTALCLWWFGYGLWNGDCARFASRLDAWTSACAGQSLHQERFGC